MTVPALFAFVLAFLTPTVRKAENLDFDVERTSMLRGFVRANEHSTTPSRILRTPSVILSTDSGRYFHGSSEIRVVAALFPTPDAARQYVRETTAFSSADRHYWSAESNGKLTALPIARWSSPGFLDQPLPKNLKNRRIDRTRPPKRGKEFPLHILANRVIIEVWPAQHPEAKRRDPKAFQRALADTDLGHRAHRIAQFLVQAAMKMPQNRQSPN